MDNIKNNFLGPEQTGNERSRISRRISGPKIIFAILGLVLLIEIVYAVKVLTAPTPSPLPRGKSVVQSSVGKIALTTPKVNYKVGEVVPIAVMVDSAGKLLDGVDLIVRFDPKTLEATTGGLIKGSMFDEYPVIQVDTKKGIVSISGISSLRTGFKGQGGFVTLNLKAKTSGQTFLTVDFQKGSTADSNLVESGTSKDILESVENLTLQIQ